MISIIKIFFRIFLIILLLIVISIPVLYLLYKDHLYLEVLTRTEDLLSESSGLPATIGSLEYVPFQQIVFKKIAFKSEEDTGRTLAHIKALMIKVDIPRTIMERSLFASVTIRDLRTENIIRTASGIVHITSNKTDSYKRIFDPALLAGLTISNGSILLENIGGETPDHLEKIYGELALDEKIVTSGELTAQCNNVPYSVSFKKMPNNDFGYDVALKSHDININSSIIKEKGSLLFGSIHGILYNIYCDLKYAVKDFSLPKGTSLTLNGNIAAELKDLELLSRKKDSLTSLPGSLKNHTEKIEKVGQFIEKNNISGDIDSYISLEAESGNVENFEFSADLSSNEFTFKDIYLNKTKGIIHADSSMINLSLLEGKIYDGSLSGEAYVNLLDPSLPYNLSLSLQNADVSMMPVEKMKIKDKVYGKLNTNIISRGNLHEFDHDTSSIFSIEKIKFGKINIDDVNGAVYLNPILVYVPFLEGALYNGSFTAEGIVDLIEPSYPYELNFSMRDSQLGSILRDLTNKPSSILGLVDINLYANGSTTSSDKTEGYGNLYVSDANLGRMPILTPLLGDIYSAFEDIFDVKDTISITSASCDFDIKERKIMTDNLVLWGKEIYITSYGSMDFDGKLDFVFQNQFRDTYEGKPEGWQRDLRDAIVAFGKVISKARLYGTIKNPEWKFETATPVKQIIQKNIQNFIKGISE